MPIPQHPLNSLSESTSNRSKQTALIVNTRSRNGQESFELSRQLLEENGVCIDTADAVDSGTRLRERIQAALHAGTELIIVGGGDGSLRTAASVLAHSDATLGVIPLGTVNDFARNLCIDPDLASACRVIAEGRTANIDIGRANDDCFLITASLGVSALMQTVLTPRMKRILGPFGYVAASLMVWRRLRHLHVTVEHDGKVEHMTVMQAGVINGHSWMGGRCEIPGVDLESGKLAFYAVPPQNNFAYLRIARRVRQGEFFHTPGLTAFSTKDVTVSTKRHYPLVLDGDLSGMTPVRLWVDAEALRVCVGEQFDVPVDGRA